MARDEEMEKRFMAALPETVAVGEKAMMGGLCYMLNGNMLGGVRRDKDGVGRFMFRVGKEQEEEALGEPLTEPMIHGGRKMGGFIFLNEETRDGPLKTLALMALDYVGALPPK